jgi:hypothetical protein
VGVVLLSLASLNLRFVIATKKGTKRMLWASLCQAKKNLLNTMLFPLKAHAHPAVLPVLCYLKFSNDKTIKNFLVLLVKEILFNAFRLF